MLTGRMFHMVRDSFDQGLTVFCLAKIELVVRGPGMESLKNLFHLVLIKGK
jgi:hypothetical protein